MSNLMTIEEILELLLEQSAYERPRWEQAALSRAANNLENYKTVYEP